MFDDKLFVFVLFPKMVIDNDCWDKVPASSHRPLFNLDSDTLTLDSFVMIQNINTSKDC